MTLRNGDGVDTKIPEQMLNREELMVNEKVSNEEYKIWKKGAPFMYNVLLVKALEWPTLTVQWMPDDKRTADLGDFSRYSLLLGTHTSSNAQDYVQFMDVDLPNGGYKGNGADTKLIKKIECSEKLYHEGEVNKARFSPLNPNRIATCAVSGEALIFDRTNEASKTSFSPSLRLKHHTKECYGLSWSPFDKDELITGSDDTTVAIWDLSRQNEQNTVEPLHVITDHSALVTDVQYSIKLPGVFGSVSEDTTALIHDKRDLSSPVMQLMEGHESSINSIAFNPFNETLVATGSSDTTVAIWDLRNTRQPIHSLKGHSGDVSSISWSPHDESVLASAAYDRRLNIWDLSMIMHEQQTAEEANEGPPELLFVHGGHTNKISDFSWHPTLPWTIATASEDNVVQVWQVAGQIADKKSTPEATPEPKEEQEPEENGAKKEE